MSAAIDRRDAEKSLSRLIHRALNKIRFVRLDRFDQVSASFENAITLLENSLIDSNNNNGNGAAAGEDPEVEDGVQPALARSSVGKRSSHDSAEWLRNIAVNADGSRVRVRPDLIQEDVPDNRRGSSTNFARPIQLSKHDNLTIDTGSPSLRGRQLGNGQDSSSAVQKRVNPLLTSARRRRGQNDSIDKSESEPAATTNTHVVDMEQDLYPKAATFQTDYSSPRLPRRGLSAPAAAAAAGTTDNEPRLSNTSSNSSGMFKHSSRASVDPVLMGNVREKQGLFDVNKNRASYREEEEEEPYMMVGSPRQINTRSRLIDLAKEPEKKKLVVKASFIKPLNSPGMRQHELQGKRKKLEARLKYARNLVNRMDMAKYPQVKDAFVEALQLIESEDNTFNAVTLDKP